MIRFETAIKPFLTQDGCGDFVAVVEVDDYFYWAVGDIGGHGSESVGRLAASCKKKLLENISLSLEDNLRLIHNDKKVREKGMTLFLARVYKKTPIIEYMGVGNIRIMFWHENHLRELHMQDGIVGYVVPTNINTNLLKLHQNDKILVGTDGVSMHVSQITQEIEKHKEVQRLVESIVDRYSHEDDALCSIMQYTYKTSALESNIYEGDIR